MWQYGLEFLLDVLRYFFFRELPLLRKESYYFFEFQVTLSNFA